MNLAQARKDASFALGILRRRPFQVLVQVTNRCNLKCSFCDFWPNPAPRNEELTVAEYNRVAEELSGLGTFLVSIEGGEPLLRPDILPIVEAFAAKHTPVLFTSGWHMNREKAAALFAAGLTHASVSIDYPDAARHDSKRGLPGTFDRAWRAVELLRDAAPHGGKQVHVMTVLMRDNADDLEALYQHSAALGVGHQVTLLSTTGFRRGRGQGTATGPRTGPGIDQMPQPGLSPRLVELWQRYPHVRFFRDYFDRVDAFLSGGPMPACGAGLQSFNLDHVGNVSPCIEKIDRVVGNIRTESLAALHQRLRVEHEALRGCQDCWTACRGFTDALGKGGTLGGWRDLSSRMRSW